MGSPKGSLKYIRAQWSPMQDVEILGPLGPTINFGVVFSHDNWLFCALFCIAKDGRGLEVHWYTTPLGCNRWGGLHFFDEHFHG